MPHTTGRGGYRSTPAHPRPMPKKKPKKKVKK